jgi:signal transduction histidine kinase
MRPTATRATRSGVPRPPRVTAAVPPGITELPGMMWVCDDEGRITWSNEAASHFFPAAHGGPPVQWTDGIVEDDLESCARVFGRARSLQEGFRLIYRRAGTTGARWILDQASPRIARGKLLGFIGMAVGIDDLKELEASLRRQNESLTRSNRDLDDVARAASHDLKEPLSIVSVYSELLKRRSGNQLDDDAGRFVRLTLDAVQRMHGLLNDLSAFLKVARVSNDLPQPVDAGSVMQAALLHHKPKIEASGGRVERDPLPVVMAQEAHLLQLFQGLIDNALKFRGEAPPHVRVGWSRQGDQALFHVTDNGIGIDPRYLEQVFGVFRRLHGYDYPGTGIGLALCSRIVEKYGGRIWVESKQGSGSTFWFTLPLAADAAGRIVSPAPHVLPETMGGTAPREGDQRSAPKSRDSRG